MSVPPPYIPFNRVGFAGNELAYISEAIERGHISGDGAFTRKCEALLQEIVGSGRTLLTTSCTHALEMAALLLEIKAGDEVIIPSFTFVSTANAFALRGATIRFADIRPDTLCIDTRLINGLITEHTRAIVPVHYAGVACDMEEILRTLKSREISIVEDNAHGLFGSLGGRNLGTFGDMATLSFHETKNISCGEGGALILNNPALVERAEIVREKGTNRSRFFRGEVDKYSWVDLGSSYVPSDILAAFLLSQLEAWEAIQSKRRSIWERYHRELLDWSNQVGARRPVVPADCAQAYHMYYILCPDFDFRSRLIQHLKSRNILAVFHYLPLHLSEMGKQSGGDVAPQCPVTEDVSDRLLRLPFYTDLSEQDQSRVIETVRSFTG